MFENFKKIKIKPQMPIGINSVSTSYTSPYGDISCRWIRKSEKIRLYVQIPANSEAIIYLPAKTAEEITESGRSLKEVGECRILEAHNENYILVSVGSGNYIFEM